MNWALYGFAGWLVLGTLVTVANIGKTRRATTPFQAVQTVLINAFLAVLLVQAAGRLK